MSFNELGLIEGLLQAIAREGYTTPTPIQAKAIPAILGGHDLLAAAQTGTGKTAAFTLPILQLLTQRLAGRPANAPRTPKALVLVPTRELAAQVAESVRTYGRDLPAMKSAVMFGGVNINPQIDQARRGIDILVATPGRLLDHVGQRTVNLSSVEILVLDEADRMLDMGFIRDIKRVLAVMPPKRQNLMFSATFSEDIRGLAQSFLKNPQTIDIAPRNSAVESVNQRVVQVDQSRKSELLAYLISSGNWRQTLVFTRTKHGANRVAEKLEKAGIKTAALHGNKSQGARTRALADFKAGTVRVLVATDIAARGLDIEELPHVVNFELPNVPEDYIHRIGRTGRAGNSGEALALVCREEKEYLRDIQRLIKRELPAFMVEGFEPGTKSTQPQEPEDARPARPPQRHGQRQGQRPGGGGNRPQRSGGQAGRGPQPARAASGSGGRPAGGGNRGGRAGAGR